ncbi:HTH_Tnp_Tc3_2 domain-containing protein [Trichonephila clavipes]|nr:HTH_Tnp_Tc3_2 domain-containing protein [Trichonephila clavipes]
MNITELVSLKGTTIGKIIRDAVINCTQIRQIDRKILGGIVTVGAPSMVEKNVGAVTLIFDHIKASGKSSNDFEMFICRCVLHLGKISTSVKYVSCQESYYQGSRNIGRLECGRIPLEVSEKLRIAQIAISRLWQRFQDDSNVSRCYSTGHPRVTTPNEDRSAKRNRRSTSSDLSRQLSSATGTTVSRQTVYRRLGHIGLYACRPVRCVQLTATYCRLRLTWS